MVPPTSGGAAPGISPAPKLGVEAPNLNPPSPPPEEGQPAELAAASPSDDAPPPKLNLNPPALAPALAHPAGIWLPTVDAAPAPKGDVCCETCAPAPPNMPNGELWLPATMLPGALPEEGTPKLKEGVGMETPRPTPPCCVLTPPPACNPPKNIEVAGICPPLPNPPVPPGWPRPLAAAAAVGDPETAGSSINR